MSDCGFLIQSSDALDHLEGAITTLRLDLTIQITRRERDGGANAPSHDVMAKGPHGKFVCIGAAWTKHIMRGENAGQSFLSLKLDDESFGDPIYLSAFHTDGEKWRITSNRPRRKPVANEDAA